MPWAMFFHGGFAIHGSNEVPNYNASHGCIRLYPADARWLNQNVLNYGSTVIVYPY
jgi:lipoprotein-anchoring transpeptidase ErfK/SrfK